jgi:hypothetical protein
MASSNIEVLAPTLGVQQVWKLQILFLQELGGL